MQDHQKSHAKSRTMAANEEPMSADSNAEYAAVIEIDLDTMTEPAVACPNDPDDVASVSGTRR